MTSFRLLSALATALAVGVIAWLVLTNDLFARDLFTIAMQVAAFLLMILLAPPVQLRSILRVSNPV